MNAIEARQKAFDQNPDLSRFYNTIKVEIKHQATKGNFQFKRNIQKDIGYLELVKGLLEKEGFEVKLNQEEILIKW